MDSRLDKERVILISKYLNPDKLNLNGKSHYLRLYAAIFTGKHTLFSKVSINLYPEVQYT